VNREPERLRPESLVTVYDGCDIKVDSYRALPVKSPDQLPSGFEPGEQYTPHALSGALARMTASSPPADSLRFPPAIALGNHPVTAVADEIAVFAAAPEPVGTRTVLVG